MNKYIDVWINKLHNVCMGIAPRSPPIEFAPSRTRLDGVELEKCGGEHGMR